MPKLIKKAVDRVKDLISDPNKKVIDDINAKLKYCEDYRFPQEKQWWELQNFIDGYHYQIYRDLQNTNTVDIRPVKLKSGQIRRTINMLRKVYRDMKSMIAVADYHWAVMGGEGTEEKYLLSYFKKYNVPMIISKVAGTAFKRSKAYVEAYWDSENRCVKLNPLDPFQIYEDPSGQFFIKTHTKRLDELKNTKGDDENPVYSNLDPQKMEETDKVGQSDLYNYYHKRQHPAGKPNEENLKKYLLKELIEPKGDSAKITTISGDVIIREETLEHYKIISYKPETEGDLYTDPLISNVLDPQKSLNRTINHLEEYIRYMAVGRYFKKKGEQFDELKAEHGHIFEYETRKPEQQRIEPMPAVVMQFVDKMIGFHSILSGMRLQEMPASISGKAMAYLQALEQQNSVEPMDNLKCFLREVGMTIINFTSDKLSIGKKMYFKEENEVKEMTVIGAGIEPEMAEESKDYKQINKVEEIDVEIVQGGPFARLNQIESAKEMYKMGLIDRQSALEIIPIGKIREVVQRAQAEEERQMALKAKYQVPAGPTASNMLGGGASPAAAITEEARKISELPARIPERKMT